MTRLIWPLACWCPYSRRSGRKYASKEDPEPILHPHEAERCTYIHQKPEERRWVGETRARTEQVYQLVSYVANLKKQKAKPWPSICNSKTKTLQYLQVTAQQYQVKAKKNTVQSKRRGTVVFLCIDETPNTAYPSATYAPDFLGRSDPAWNSISGVIVHQCDTFDGDSQQQMRYPPRARGSLF